MSLPKTFVANFHDENSVHRMEYLDFGRTGMKVSKISIGGGTLSKFYGDRAEKEGVKTIRSAIKRGINYIDTAPWYGQGRSEELLGEALKGIPRESYYIATKVGRYELDYANMFDFTAAKTRQSVENSLKLLGLDFLDVVQIHDIEFSKDLKIIWHETLPALEELRKEGKLRFIGISAYPMDVLKMAILGAPSRFDTVLCYARNTLIDHSLKDYLPFFIEQNVAVISASGHGMGLLTNDGPQPWHPAQKIVKDVCQEAGEFCRENSVELGKLAMWHFIQMKGPSTFLVGMQTLELLDINLDAYYNGLNEKETKVLNHLKER